MNDDRKQDLTKKLILGALKKYRGLVNRNLQPNDEDLDLYADMLCEEYEFKQVTWALSECFKGGSAYYPSCGEIFAKLSVKKESLDMQAPVVATEIIQAIRNFSQYDEERMYASISDEAKAVLRANGGTQTIRDSENFETMRAQLERLAKGVISNVETLKKAEHLEAIGINTGKAKKLKSEFKTLDYSDFQLKDGA